MMSDRYSSTFGSSLIVGSPATPTCCSDTENLMSSGIARKNTTSAPRMKKIGVATR